MPYINPIDRPQFDKVFSGFFPTTADLTAGGLNYLITRLILRYIEATGGTSYTRINEVIGVLECAKLELYRRRAAAYEDKKMDQNGDVYNGI